MPSCLTAMTSGIRPHTAEWYERIARVHGTYEYPWNSSIGEDNADSAYATLVFEHLREDIDVVDCGCAQGTDALWIAPHVRGIVGYDQVADFIGRAEANCQAQGITNARFVVANSSAAANGGSPRLPLPSGSIDLFVSRRGPTHWIADAPRVARPRAVLIQLNPTMCPLPRWTEELPPQLLHEQFVPEAAAEAALEGVVARLRSAGLELDKHWIFDTREWFHSPHDLYEYLTWGKDLSLTPEYGVVSQQLERIFDRYADASGLEHRRGGLLWKAST